MSSRLNTKTFAIAAVVVCLMLAGILSYYASGSPDGLNRVAIDKGFDAQEKDHASSDSPLAGYAASGISNERLSGAVAGVAVVLALGGGLGYVVRRRERAETPSASPDTSA